MPGISESVKGTLDHALGDLILEAHYRRALLLEFRHALFLMDKQLVDKCREYLADPASDTSSMLYQTVRSYLTDNFTRRPLYIAMHNIDLVLANPNFLKEFYLILVVFLQFKDVVKTRVAGHTLEPAFRRFFTGFYNRFKTFIPGTTPLQTVDSFIQSEFSLFLIAMSITNLAASG